MDPEKIRLALDVNEKRIQLEQSLCRLMRQTTLRISRMCETKSKEVESEILRRRREIEDEEKTMHQKSIGSHRILGKITHMQHQLIHAIENEELRAYVTGPENGMPTQLLEKANFEQLVEIAKSLDAGFFTVDCKWMDELMEILEGPVFQEGQPPSEARQQWARIRNHISLRTLSTTNVSHEPGSVDTPQHLPPFASTSSVPNTVGSYSSTLMGGSDSSPSSSSVEEGELILGL